MRAATAKRESAVEVVLHVEQQVEQTLGRLRRNLEAAPALTFAVLGVEPRDLKGDDRGALRLGWQVRDVGFVLLEGCRQYF